ncbi:iron-sulfur cluster assembly accessory protein [Xanthobacter autotrophicus]|uniref:HesB/IscA family protein n=1 Tax=Xanthobacter TaxID=279 RepID=UPI0024AB3A54|nr:iron-sulfur cluster biosynthesis family protein [Xanthobacter autotrophicus]MDI4666501.1 iron-sulfur cluster assembly accessory protein [Xanthobacter autotrophicus]
MITLTTNALSAIKAALSGSAQADGLRVVAKAGTGASVNYLMHLESRARDGDLILEQGGLKLFIDGASRSVARGIVIDFVDSATARGFVFEDDPAALMMASGGLRN